MSKEKVTHIICHGNGDQLLKAFVAMTENNISVETLDKEPTMNITKQSSFATTLSISTDISCLNLEALNKSFKPDCYGSDVCNSTFCDVSNCIYRPKEMQAQSNYKTAIDLLHSRQSALLKRGEY